MQFCKFQKRDPISHNQEISGLTNSWAGQPVASFPGPLWIHGLGKYMCFVKIKEKEEVQKTAPSAHPTGLLRPPSFSKQYCTNQRGNGTRERVRRGTSPEGSRVRRNGGRENEESWILERWKRGQVGENFTLNTLRFPLSTPKWRLTNSMQDSEFLGGWSTRLLVFYFLSGYNTV